MYQGIPKDIHPVDTSPGWAQQGRKLLLTGRVYGRDGKTPAPGVLLYYYHTNTAGRYLHDPQKSARSLPPNSLGQTHGNIRGWVRTDGAGRYAIYTVKPGVYPSRTEPAHVHAAIKEPGNINEYYIDDFVFEDDKLLTAAKRARQENRCGSGVLRLVRQGDLSIGERDLVLGLNIPGYPAHSVR